MQRTRELPPTYGARSAAVCFAALAAVVCGVVFSHTSERQAAPCASTPVDTPATPEVRASGVKGLVVFVALGRRGTGAVVRHNAERHFRDWACVVYAYRDEDRLPLTGADAPPTRCDVIRLPGLLYGHFLKTLSPTVVSAFTHVAVVLDDCFLGSFDAATMISTMLQHDLAVASPVVHGAGTPLMRPARRRSAQRMLRVVKFVEVHATVFRADAWACFWSLLWHGNGHGYGYDMCYHSVCSARKPALGRMGVLESHSAYHLEKARPRSLPAGMRLPNITKGAGASDAERMAVARRWENTTLRPPQPCRVDRTVYAKVPLSQSPVGVDPRGAV